MAIWMVATRSGRPVALGRRLGSERPLGAPRPKLGLPFAAPAVAISTLGKRSRRTLGMARRMGSRRHLGAPGSKLGLPLAIADSWPHPFSKVGCPRLMLRKEPSPPPAPTLRNGRLTKGAKKFDLSPEKPGGFRTRRYPVWSLHFGLHARKAAQTSNGSALPSKPSSRSDLYHRAMLGFFAGNYIRLFLVELRVVFDLAEHSLAYSTSVSYLREAFL
jgi:hypothetical protein